MADWLEAGTKAPAFTLAADDGRFLSPLTRCIKAGDDFRAAVPLLAPLQLRPPILDRGLRGRCTSG